jgi:ribonuclease D
MLITDTPTLESFCRDLENAPYIAVDTEFMRVKTYRPKLCLVQVAFGDVFAAIDPLAKDISLEPLFALLHSEVLKVFHAASQDLEVFLQVSGSVPTPIYDTQIASMVAGFGEQVGYAALASKIAKVTLDKASQRTDWSLRPLTERQIAYAISDVTHLCTIYETLKSRLDETGRSAWVAEEMTALADPEQYRVHPEDAYRRIKLRSPSRRTLVILRELAAWRERAADHRNLPRNWVVRDEALIEIASHAISTTKALERVRGMNNGKNFRDGDKLLGCVETALAIPESEWPELPPRRGPARGNDSLIALLQALLRDRSVEHGVAQQLIAKREDLDRLAVDDEADIATLRGWRRTIFGEDALALKHGRLALTGSAGTVKAVAIETDDAKTKEPAD